MFTITAKWVDGPNAGQVFSFLFQNAGFVSAQLASNEWSYPLCVGTQICVVGEGHYQVLSVS